MMRVVPAPVTWIERLASHTHREDPAAAEAVLVRYPLALGQRESDRAEKLLAELADVTETNATAPRRLRAPRRLLELADELTTQHGPTLEAARRSRDEAVQAGLATADLHYPLVPGIPAILIEYARLMDQIDVYCRAGTLRTPVTPVDLYALRQWVVEEFVRQYDGHEPRPWEGPLR